MEYVAAYIIIVAIVEAIASNFYILPVVGGLLKFALRICYIILLILLIFVANQKGG